MPRFHSFLQLLFAAISFTAELCGQAQPGISPLFSRVPFWENSATSSKVMESYFVFYDVPAQQYVVTYPAKLASGNPHDFRRVELRLDKHSTVEPEIVTSITKSTEGLYSYQYEIRNGSKAKTDLRRFALIAASHDESIELKGKVRWLSELAHIPKNTAARDNGPALKIQAQVGRLVSWRIPNHERGLKPASESELFTINSSFLPGITIAYFSNDLNWDLPQDLPEIVRKQLELAKDPDSNWKPQIIIGPKFSPTEAPTNDPIWIANDFRASIERMRSNNPTFQNSKFLDELNQILENIAFIGQRVSLELRNRPTNRLESDILQAAIASLEPRK
ncbi:MAG: hypothetical protein K7J46_06110 [Bryobacter sp.]|jgi:hypothetical protein|nr:hypothetical protein [Bryobacter sp. CoA8 C33]